MKIRKIFTAITALTLAVSMLAGCGGNGATTDSSTSTASQSTTADSTSGGREKVNGVMYKEGLPIVDPGSYSFTLFVDDGQEDDIYVMLPILEKQTGIKVNLQKYPYTVAQEKLALALNSGDYADCIGGWTLKEQDILTLGMDEGVYIPLDKYYEDYAPKITEILGLEGVRNTMTTPDGHIYSIPYALEAPYVPFNPFINTKWLKNVGMEVPKTIEEFEKVLQAFKDKDANGNGNPNDEIPFTTGPDNKGLGLLAGYFGVSVDKYGFTMDGDKLAFGANTEQYKKGMKWLSDLYKKGLIDKEIFTQDSSQWKAKGAKDIYGASIMYASSDIMPYDPGVTPDWAPVPVLTGGSDKPVFLRNTYGTTVLKYQAVITDKAKNPEAIVRWWDNLFQLENTLQTHNGPLDITLFKTDDGGYRKIDTTTLTKEQQKEYDWGNLFPQSLPRYTPAGFKIKEDVPVYQEKPVVDKLYEPYLTKVIPDVWVSAEDSTKMADSMTAIENYLKQKTAEWISGQVDIEKDWDAYLKQLDKLKINELVEMRQKAMGMK